MAQTKITSKSLAANTIAASNIADGAIETRHIAPTTFSPAVFSDKTNISTGYFTLPAGTTAQRPTLGVPNGAIRFNTDFGYYEWYDNFSTLWLKMDEKRPAYLTIGGTITTITDPRSGYKYRVHTFTTPGVISTSFSRIGAIDFLLVGGGGSGGNHNTTNANGGGGGGGIVYKKDHYIRGTSFQLKVGGGGAAVGYQISSSGNNGDDSYFHDSNDTNNSLFYRAFGGGGGASSNATGTLAMPGGSGGGVASRSASNQGRSIQEKYSDAQTYGNDGGRTSRDWTGAGGGGASEVGIGGANLNSARDGDGGKGMEFDISGTRKWYGGGGGGGGNSSEKAGDGWHGGGRGFGTTQYYTNLNYPLEVNLATLGSGTPDGIDGTGGGGGAGSYWSNGSTNWLNKGSGAGGDGIVIIRYRIA